MSVPVAVVTGASSGIGEATARHLGAAGFHVVCVARRSDRIEALASEIGGTAYACDITDEAAVAGLRDALGDLTSAAGLSVLVNNAGGAFGLEPIESADTGNWRRMFEVNVLGTLAVTRALLPALEASGAATIVNVSSTAARVTYEGGAGYTGAKHAVAAMTETLRLELAGRPVRVCEVAPGMVATDEFSLNRFGGDRDRADAVYAGVDAPLVADDIADVITFAVTRPQHVNIDLLVVKPIAQAAQHKVVRTAD